MEFDEEESKVMIQRQTLSYKKKAGASAGLRILWLHPDIHQRWPLWKGGRGHYITCHFDYGKTCTILDKR